MTRQLSIDAETVTPEDWADWSILERSYAVVNPRGEFPLELAGEVEFIDMMLPPWSGARDFLTIER